MPIDLASTSNSLTTLFKEAGFKTGAEIGVAAGLFSETLCQSIPRVKLHCIDPWTTYIGCPWDDHENKYIAAQKRLKPYRCSLIRKTSTEAAKDFPDESLDFVYIDANHRYEHVVADIAAWLPKVRKDGIISGDDYIQFVKQDVQHYSHVITAVCGWTSSYFIRPWFTLSGRKYKTWLWVKT